MMPRRETPSTGVTTGIASQVAALHRARPDIWRNGQIGGVSGGGTFFFRLSTVGGH